MLPPYPAADRRALSRMLCGLCLLTTACGEPFSGVELTLVPDGNINTEAMLVALVKTLRIELDSPEGLYGLGDRRAEGNQTIADTDGDGKAELRVDFPMGDELPTIQIEPGGLPKTKQLELRVYGLDEDGEMVARGALNSVSMPNSGVTPLDVYFNTLPELWPPQVTQSIPQNGARDLEGVNVVELFFSHVMDEASLLAKDTVTLHLLEGSQETLIPAASKTLLRSGERTSMRYELDSALSPGSYRVQVSDQATTLAGQGQTARALDQRPIEPGNQPYVAVFTVGVEAISQASSGLPLPDVCDTALPSSCPEGYQCREADRARCIKAECTCDTPWVCDAANLCRADCRLVGCTRAEVCSQQSGLCTTPKGD